MLCFLVGAPCQQLHKTCGFLLNLDFWAASEVLAPFGPSNFLVPLISSYRTPAITIFESQFIGKNDAVNNMLLKVMN